MEILIQPMATVRGSCTSFNPSDCPVNFGSGTCSFNCTYLQ